MQSAAAYLLFYRRRSEKPLGPPSLQDLVLSERNPEVPAEDGEESETGEARLGGPKDSLRGSPSAFGVVAETSSANRLDLGSGGHGAGAAAGSNLTPSQMMRSPRNEEESPYGYKDGQPLFSIQSAQDGAWCWDSIDHPPETETLINSVEDHDDSNSTHAEADTSGAPDSAYGGGSDDDAPYETAWPNTADDYSYQQHSAGSDTLVESMGDMTDNHAMYSAPHESQDADIDALHLEDTGTTGPDPEAAEIHLSPVDDRTEGSAEMDMS